MSSFGGLKLSLSNSPSVKGGRSQAELGPIKNIQNVELRNGDRVVLQGHFAPVEGGSALSGQLVEKRTPLMSTGLLLQAGGKAHVEVEGNREELTIEAARLAPGSDCRLTILLCQALHRG